MCEKGAIWPSFGVHNGPTILFVWQSEKGLILATPMRSFIGA